MDSTANRNSEQIEFLRAFNVRPLLSYQETRDYFVPIIEEVKKLHLAVDTFENSIIIGERGSGKSSLLNRFAYDLENHSRLLVVKVSVLNIEPFEQVPLLLNILNEIREIAKNRSNKEKLNEILKVIFASRAENEPNSNDIEQQPDYYSILKKFSNLVQKLRQDKFQICIILDDTDKIDPKSIWQVFRNMRDEIWKLKISIIITALPNQVSEITKPPLDHFFPYWIKLSPFNLEMTKELIRRRLSEPNQKINISDDALEEIVKRADGNPRDILEILRKLFEQSEITKAITRKEIDNLGLIFAQKMPDLERAVCNYLIEHPYTSASSEDFKEKMGVSRSRLAQILIKLRSQGLIGSQMAGKSTIYYVTENGLKRQNKT